MAVPSARGIFHSTTSRAGRWIRSHVTLSALILGLLDLVIMFLVTSAASYTEIDWSTYMQQVKVFLSGERDYAKIEGDTGPVVYPANFLYIFSVLYEITDSGTNIGLAQSIFCVLHAVNVVIVARTYLEDVTLPIPVLVLLLCSRRIASIYALRLFNDGIEAILANAAVLLFVRRKFTFSCVLLSLAVGVKMNGLLYAPALGIVMLQSLGLAKTLMNVLLCIGIQARSRSRTTGDCSNVLGKKKAGCAHRFCSSWCIR